MNSARFKALCLGFPGAIGHVQWGEHLVFKVAGKMFVVANAEGGTIRRF
jgi:predicted DNA-binding protein (MmcQ/YjbR family)